MRLILVVKSFDIEFNRCMVILFRIRESINFCVGSDQFHDDSGTEKPGNFIDKTFHKHRNRILNRDDGGICG